MWLYLPKTISPASRESADSISPSDSLCQTLSVSATWRAKFLLPRIWRVVLRKAPLMTRLSGLTLEPSTAQRGVDSWMESLRASRAQTTPSPAGAQESSESTDNSGMTYAVSFAKFNPNGCIWKTYPESLFPTRFDAGDGIVTNEDGRLIACLPDSGLCLETWPYSGSMRNGVVYQQPKLALRIKGTDGSAWPTARAEDSESCGNHPNSIDSLGGGQHGTFGPVRSQWTEGNKARTANKERT